jgi:hypothetical protein
LNAAALDRIFCEYEFAPGNSPVEVQREIFDTFLLRKVYAVYVDWRAGFSSCGECDVDRFGLDSFYIASRLVCIFYKAMPGSLFVASTAVSSANVAGVDSVEVGKSAVYSRCNSGPRTLPWGTPA